MVPYGMFVTGDQRAAKRVDEFDVENVRLGGHLLTSYFYNMVLA